MFYAVSESVFKGFGPQVRRIASKSESLRAGEVVYDGPIKWREDGFGVDMVFDPVTGLRPKTDEDILNDIKEAAFDKLKETCETVLKSGCLTSLGFRVDCDDRSISLLTSTASIVKQLQPETITFCDFENQTHLLTYSEFETLALEVGYYVQTVYQRKWELRKRIVEAQSTTEVQAITR